MQSCRIVGTCLLLSSEEYAIPSGIYYSVVQWFNWIVFKAFVKLRKPVVFQPFLPGQFLFQTLVSKTCYCHLQNFINKTIFQQPNNFLPNGHYITTEWPYKLKHARLTRPFIEGATQKGRRKEHCMCIKQKQNISSQSFLRSPLTLKSSFQFVWLGTTESNLDCVLCWKPLVLINPEN